MAEQELSESQPMQDARGGITEEIVRLVKLLRRLEHENAALRRELGARPATA
jgi:hypothetical protein